MTQHPRSATCRPTPTSSIPQEHPNLHHEVHVAGPPSRYPSWTRFSGQTLWYRSSGSESNPGTSSATILISTEQSWDQLSARPRLLQGGRALKSLASRRVLIGACRRRLAFGVAECLLGFNLVLLQAAPPKGPNILRRGPHRGGLTRHVHIVPHPESFSEYLHK